ncbi:hypothetical protein [Vibrio parahaemolyticus]|uniref:hypothetical protein n=1 Tax=Vibrio parahaemolyticus TaxID=670 RepID=UPI0023612E62|nr:hypothetical protein [Vibrio parahaemolyticus]
MLFAISEKALATRVNAALFNGDMTDKQKNGCERYIVAYFLLRMKRMRIPLSYLAYTLATVYHETAHQMQPVE